MESASPIVNVENGLTVVLPLCGVTGAPSSAAWPATPTETVEASLMEVLTTVVVELLVVA